MTKWKLLNRRTYFVNFSTINNLFTFEKLCQTGVKNYRNQSIGGLLKFYKNSPFLAISNLFPEHLFLPWFFRIHPKKIWNDFNLHREYLKWIEKKINITSKEQWYNVTKQDFIKLKGRFFIQEIYHSSVSSAVRKIFPEYNLMAWKFKRVPEGFWLDRKHQRNFYQWIAEQNQFKRLDELYSLNNQEISKLGGWSLGRNYSSSHFHNLILCFPEKNPIWEPSLFLSLLKTQYSLFKQICLLFPNQEINFNQKYNLTSTETGQREPIELDIYLPNLKIAFEYQGEQHFQFYYLSGNPKKNKQLDEKKKKICESNGISLIYVPYWWNKTMEILESEIYKILPSVIKKADTRTTL